MSGYIDENARIADDIHNAYEEGYADGKRDAVVHGHWINSGYACGETDWECSVCHCHEWRTGKTEYCMRCGAKMDEPTQSNDSNTLDALGEKVKE